jgi:hypothetical protein
MPGVTEIENYEPDDGGLGCRARPARAAEVRRRACRVRGAARPRRRGLA